MVAVPNTTVLPSRSLRSHPSSLVPTKPAPGRMAIAPTPTQPGTLAVRPSVADLRTYRREDRAIAPHLPRTTAIEVLPTRQPLPTALRALMMANRVMAPVAVLLIGLLAAAYGWRVYTQEAWNAQFQRLQYLERQERQLIAADEMVKNQLAEEALSAQSGLVTSTLNNTIFLDEPSPPPAVITDPAAVSPVAPVVSPDRPFGY